MKQKLIEVLGSSNAMISVLSIVLLGLTSNDIFLDQTPQELIDMFTGKNAGQIVTLLLINFFGPASKLVRKFMAKEWSWDFIKSANFQTQILSLITIVIGAVADQALTGILVALLLQVWNLIVHLLKPAKNVQEGEG